MKNKKRGNIIDAIALDGEVEMDEMYLGDSEINEYDSYYWTEKVT